MSDDVLTRDNDGNLAVRTVSSTGDNYVNPDDVYTRDSEGKLCVRTTGAGGGDQHNLGWYATQAALEEAYPTATAGDWAIVGATDTVWIWDTDNSAWVDSDQKGQVTSVNNQTGDVTLTASDVGALPSDTHIPADQVNADWNANSGVAEILNKPTLGTMAAESADDYTKTANLATVATTGAYSDLSGTPTIPDPTQVSTLPTASADELGNIYQFIGTTDANYTNGYFYKCVSDGQQPATYSWTQVNVQPQGSSLPSQTGNAGKFLTTDGTDASWGNTLTTSLYIDKANDTPRTYIMPNYIYLYEDKNNTTNRIGIFSSWVSGSDFGDSGVYENIILDGRRGSNYGAVLGRSNYMLKAVFTEKLVNDSYVITLPSYAGTMVVANYTGATAGQVLTLDSNGKPVWANTTTTPSTMPMLAVADWANNTQTVNVTGVTATNTVFVSPAPASATDYASAGIVCTAQGAGTLTFTCTTVPSNAITVNVVCL